MDIALHTNKYYYYYYLSQPTWHKARLRAHLHQCASGQSSPAQCLVLPPQATVRLRQLDLLCHGAEVMNRLPLLAVTMVPHSHDTACSWGCGAWMYLAFKAGFPNLFLVKYTRASCHNHDVFIADFLGHQQITPCLQPTRLMLYNYWAGFYAWVASACYIEPNTTFWSIYDMVFITWYLLCDAKTRCFSQAPVYDTGA